VKILIRAVGKMRDKRLTSLCEEYAERARRHVPIAIDEVEDDEGLLRGLPPATEIIALEPEGDAWTTAEFTKYLEKRMVQGTRALAFLIGGADGLAPATVKRAQRRLSLSPLTLPHRLARVLLCEQIYRALSILRNEPYNR
jgi:23S rRNA (pseudouridine1915-N3)-methyltransferase